ncbi:hypothetical protein L0664_00285 [Octadecabacter sp. G9-8]|uniref:Peptidase S8/S53 domain-containing protein n=1 Tax=Octadecabacter dasysiphoniae TaxID=2909341 RepID=A0ABS9CQI5_9RHOB|nr:hypothetical protein [Octadecabacter dasysiphoniae]MCF2869487.1 hypothetical protein [Octadecabacter dasysiphoniae]
MSADRDWTSLPARQTPYTNWFFAKERDVFYQTERGEPSDEKNAFTAKGFDTQSFLTTGGREILRSLGIRHTEGGGLAPENVEADSIPFLSDSVDPVATNVNLKTEPLPNIESLAQRLDPNAVLTGVIDVGISPFHERFRASSRTTRIITCWQQAGPWVEGSHLPFGSELTACDIDGVLEGDPFDEETALRQHHVSRPEVLFGPREVDFRAAHGTHIADLAAGAVPSAKKGEKIKNPILAVNMPPRYSHGSAGNFLEFFAFAAVVRIVELADQLWQAVHKDKPGGFPIVINLSFGMQAGAKDGSAAFERLVQDLVSKRGAPTDIVMPAGNDNLNRGTARALVGADENTQRYVGLEPEEKLLLGWRVPPSDRSSNFLELWFPAMSPNRNDIEFRVTQPGVEPNPDQWHKVIGSTDLGKPENQFMDILQGAVRIYRMSHDQDGSTEVRPQIVIGLMPTEFFGSMATAAPSLAPAGLWTLEVRGTGEAVNVYAHIQSDQDIRPGRGRQTIRSYFDLELYDTHTSLQDGNDTVPIGMPRDSVYLSRAFEDRFTHLDNWRKEGPVQRKGTNNSIATTPSIIVIGAFRVSDKTATVYSATVEDERFQEGQSLGRETPVIEALLPGDDSPMHLGMLGAGSRSGSVVALQGTSSSSALAARAIVEWRLDAEDRRQGQSPQSFFSTLVDHAGYFEKAPLKVGNGLILTETEYDRHRARLTSVKKESLHPSP